jgi:hypothetical protein
MNDFSPNDPRYQEPADVTSQVAASDWNRAEINAPADDLPKRERIFPPKVLIGWALFALALYFGVRIVPSAIKEFFLGLAALIGYGIRLLAGASKLESLLQPTKREKTDWTDETD